MSEPRKLCASCAVYGVAACNVCCAAVPRSVDWKSRAEKAEARIARMQSEPAYREDAYDLVESELRAHGITQVNVREGLCTAIRSDPRLDYAERAPMPTLLGAVDLLGKP